MKQIMVFLSAGESPALGNVWRITAKKTDFYLDPLGRPGGTVHLSVHGANDRFNGHRFHIKVDRQMVSTVQQEGDFLEHGIPPAGFAFDGEQVARGVFRVARIRWTWDLQRPRFRSAAAVAGPIPELDSHQSGVRLSGMLQPNGAWDLDVFVSYNEPYWPNPHGSLRDNARLGPLTNAAGLWLTATSYHRSQSAHPTPKDLVPRLPRRGETPIRILCGGPGLDGESGMFWFVETITSRALLEASSPRARQPCRESGATPYPD